MNTRELIQDAIANGGGTYYLGENSEWVKLWRADGYVVAEPNGIENWPLGLGSGVVDGVAKQWGLKDSGFFLGLWLDENTNWSIDKVSHVDSLYWAKQAAIRNKQRAFWDVANNKEVRISA